MHGLRRRCTFVLVAALLAFAGAAQAQESRGTILGQVTDATGAIVVGAQVTVVNTGTNATMTLRSSASGQYAALYLNPGTYKVSVEHAGFRKVVNESVEVRVGSRVTLDFKLEPKGVTEEIEVVVERPLLDDASATSGQVVDSKLIGELPNGDGTAYAFTRLVPATTFEGGYALQRPMDNGNLFGERVGGTGRSEFSIDGSSNVVNVSGSAAMGISPPAEAVQEFKFETVAYDAQVGHTGAGAVNLVLKSGSNQLHGSAYFSNRNDSRSANDYASNMKGLPKPPRNYNIWGAVLSGPIVKDKLFFMASYENLRDHRTESGTYTVPTEKMRTGDFSELLTASNPIYVYNPFTARKVGSIVQRDAFVGNRIPQNLLNPVALALMKYYPLPNQAGKADLTDNYFVQQPWDYLYDLEMIRLDQVWNQSNRSYIRFTRNWRDERRYDWTGVIDGINLSSGVDSRYNYNLAVGHTAVLSPSLFLDIRAAAIRFESWQRPDDELDLASLGFSQDAVSAFRGFKYVPRFAINNGIASPGYLVTAYGSPRKVPYYNYSVNPTLTKTLGGHVIKLGYDFRMLRENNLNDGYKAGYYTFDGTYTRQFSNSTNQQGQGLAAFLLGIPTSGTIDTNAARSNEVISHSVFIQDDWRVSSKLTLNIGVRYDYELAMTERYNRNRRGFDLTSVNPIAAQAQANYAANYAKNPGNFPVAPSQFQVLGGYTFATADSPGAWDPVTDNIQPRFGFAYKLDDKTVVRGGVGLFTQLFEILGSQINQTGYSRSTSELVTQDQGLTFRSNLTNPFPGGEAALLQPVGASMGLTTNLGNSPGTVVPLERKNQKFWRFTFGIQRQLPGNIVAEVQYVGSVGRNLPVNNNINAIPQQYRSSSNKRDSDKESWLSTQVANPFVGLLPDAPGVNGVNIARSRLLVPYPHFGDINLEQYDGSNRYNAASIRLEKRLAKGFSLIANYTYSRFTEKITRLNPWDPLEERFSGVDRPHRVVVAAVAQLPFGKGHKWGSNWSSLIDSVFGGWQLSVNYQYQTGEPYTWGNVYWDYAACGDPKKFKSTLGHIPGGGRYGFEAPALDTSCFYQENGQPFTDSKGNPVTYTASQISLGNNVRTFPTVLPNFRAMNHNSLDAGLSKAFRIGSRAKLTLRVDAINALNTTIFRASTLSLTPTSAGFGLYSSAGQSTVVMYPRDFQIGAKLTF